MSPVPTGNPTIRRALLFAGPIAHKNHIIQLNGRLTCGPGLDMAMEPGSYPSWHANCTHPGSSLGPAVPCNPSWHAMVGPGCDRKITRTPPLRHRCLVSNLHPVRAMLYKQVIHPPMGPFSRASTLPGLQSTQSTCWTTSSDWDNTVLNVDLRRV